MEQLRPLTRLQNGIYLAGGILLLVGALLPLFAEDFAVAFYVYAAGAVAFAWMQAMQRYDGRRLTVRRLRRQQLIGAFLLVVTAALMYTHWQRIPPLRGDEWKVTLAVAALLEVYTAFRLPAELSRED